MLCSQTQLPSVIIQCYYGIIDYISNAVPFVPRTYSCGCLDLPLSRTHFSHPHVSFSSGNQQFVLYIYESANVVCFVFQLSHISEITYCLSCLTFTFIYSCQKRHLLNKNFQEQTYSNVQSGTMKLNDLQSLLHLTHSNSLKKKIVLSLFICCFTSGNNTSLRIFLMNMPLKHQLNSLAYEFRCLMTFSMKCFILIPLPYKRLIKGKILPGAYRSSEFIG